MPTRCLSRWSTKEIARFQSGSVEATSAAFLAAAIAVSGKRSAVTAHATAASAATLANEPSHANRPGSIATFPESSSFPAFECTRARLASHASRDDAWTTGEARVGSTRPRAFSLTLIFAGATAARTADRRRATTAAGVTNPAKLATLEADIALCFFLARGTRLAGEGAGLARR